MAEHTKNTTPDRQDQGTTAHRSEYALDPGLRARIAAFIDRFFEGEDEVEVSGIVFGKSEALDYDVLGGVDLDAVEGADFDKAEKTLHVHCCCDSVLAEEAPALGAAPQGLRAWLDQVDEPFTTTLLALIDHKGMQDTEVYKRAHISRQLFSRIRSDANYRPAKETVLALAVGLQLNPEEARDLLERAGYALSRSSKRDVIVEYFLENGVYNIMDINAALHEFDQALL